MRIDWINWLNEHHGLWGLLGVIIAILSLLASTVFLDDKKIDNEDPIKPLSPTSNKSRTFSVIEGEDFQAYGASGLFIAALQSGRGIASIKKKHGAFFDQNGEILGERILLLNKPLKLSAICTLTITDVNYVQGHSSFNILVKREDK